MNALAKYEGMTWCLSDNWEEQEKCEHSEQSPVRGTCMWRGLGDDNRCGHPDACKKAMEEVENDK